MLSQQESKASCLQQQAPLEALGPPVLETVSYEAEVWHARHGMQMLPGC